MPSTEWCSIKVRCCYVHVPESQADISLRTQNTGHRAISDTSMEDKTREHILEISTKTVTHMRWVWGLEVQNCKQSTFQVSEISRRWDEGVREQNSLR